MGVLRCFHIVHVLTIILPIIEGLRDFCSHVRRCGVKLMLLALVLLSLYLSLWMISASDQWLPRFPKPSEQVFFNHSLYRQRFPLTRTNLNRTLSILLWTPKFGDLNWSTGDLSTTFSSCRVFNCVLTNQKTDIVRADAVLFHAWDYWNYGFGYTMPNFRDLRQLWILFNFEPPPQTVGNFPDLFNWTASYREDSDIVVPSLQVIKLRTPKSKVQNIAASKSAGVAWVASNCADDARRQLLVRELEKYINVDTYGKCGKYPLKDIEVLRKYKFYLAFENSFCRDYITEKFTRPLTHNSLPVVSGGGDYTKVAPPHSYIDVRDFNNVKDLATYLKYLDSNDTAYNSYFHWMKNYIIEPIPDVWCRLCEAVHDETRFHQVYTDMDGYLNDDTCHKWTLTSFIYRTVQGTAIKLGII